MVLAVWPSDQQKCWFKTFFAHSSIVIEVDDDADQR